jgi:Heat shock protein
MRPLLLAVAAAGAVILAACSSVASPGAPALDLAGRTFLSTDAQGLTLVPGTRVALTFKEDGSLGAGAGCNSMGGAYTIDGDRLTTGPMMTTEMGCDAARMTQDQWLAAFLANVKISLAGDTLTLDDGTVLLTLVDKRLATPNKPIEGTTWVVDGIVTGEAVSSVPDGATGSVRIADGTIDVQTGCNAGGGPVTIAADTLTFGPLIFTNMACVPATSAVEAAMRAVLTGTVKYTIDADTLTLDAGANGLILRAAP